MIANTSVMGGNAPCSNPGSTSSSVTLSKLVNKLLHSQELVAIVVVVQVGEEERLGMLSSGFSANFNSLHVLRFVCIQCYFC